MAQKLTASNVCGSIERRLPGGDTRQRAPFGCANGCRSAPPLPSFVKTTVFSESYKNTVARPPI
jgi:hypothetical protein